MKPTTPTDRRPGTTARDEAIEAAAADWVARVDAGLTKEEQQIFQDWLSADARHADAFDRFTEAWSVFDRVQERGAASAILDQLTERARRRKVRRVQAGVAAALVLAAGLAWFQWRAAAPAGQPPESQLATIQPAAPDPIRRLPDGSIVELKAGAEIVVQYSDTERRVKLVKGEAFFRVEKNKARPFYVEANGVIARAVGTAFAVQMQPSAVEVVVQEGVVDVGRTTATGGPATNPVRVEAGKKVVMALLLLRPARSVAPKTPAESVAPPEQPEAMTDEQMNSRLAWRQPWLKFDGMTLADAAALMNRHNHLQLHIEGESLNDFRVTGTFRTDNPEGFVRMVELEVGDVVTERRGSGEIVLRRAAEAGR